MLPLQPSIASFGFAEASEAPNAARLTAAIDVKPNSATRPNPTLRMNAHLKMIPRHRGDPNRISRSQHVLLRVSTEVGADPNLGFARRRRRLCQRLLILVRWHFCPGRTQPTAASCGAQRGGSLLRRSAGSRGRCAGRRTVPASCGAAMGVHATPRPSLPPEVVKPGSRSDGDQ